MDYDDDDGGPTELNRMEMCQVIIMEVLIK